MEAPQRDQHLAARLARAEARLALYVSLRLGPALTREHDPTDVVQDVLVEAWDERGHLEDRGDAALAGWLCQLAERRIVDLARRAGRDKRPPSERRLEASALLAAARATATGPASAAAQREAHARLEAALASLDDDMRAAVLGRHFEGLTLEALAARLGRSEPSVRRLLGRATVTLGAAMRAFGSGGPA